MEYHKPKCKNSTKEKVKSTSRKKQRHREKEITSEDSGGESGDGGLGTKRKTLSIRKSNQSKPKKMFPCNVCGKQMISASKLR